MINAIDRTCFPFKSKRDTKHCIDRKNAKKIFQKRKKKKIFYKKKKNRAFDDYVDVDGGLVEMTRRESEREKSNPSKE